MEAYKANAVDSIVQRMSVLAKFPDQVVVLKGTQYVCALKGKRAGLTQRMIYREATDSFSDFCQFIKRAQAGDAWYIRQIQERQMKAAEQLSAVEDGGADILKYYAVFETQFSESEKRNIRIRRPLKLETLQKLAALVAMFARDVYEDHPYTGRWPKPSEWPYTFIYRSAVLHYLHFFEWIRNGSSRSIAAAKVRNDLVDINFATYATFFDGLMTDDARTSALYHEGLTYINELFIPTLTRSWESKS